jgi:signal transduction histidine kinase
VSLRARLLLALGYLVALVIVAFAVPLALNLRERASTEVKSQARTQADVLAAGLGGLVTDDREGARIAALSATVGRAARARVVVVSRRGTVLADSADPQAIGANFSSRPEIAAALAGRRVQERRRSDTLDQDILATAGPVFEEGAVVGAVRLTQSVEAVDASVRRTVAGIAAVGLAVLLAALFVAYLLARQITRPIERLGGAADRLAAGDLETRVLPEGSREQRTLAASFNSMADRLARALRAQGEFVADASHQLRTPLTGLRLRLEEARASRTPDEAAPHLDAAIGELDRMTHTIADLLVLSRTGERDTPGEAVHLGDVVTDACRRWEKTAAANAIALTAATRGAGTVWAARADLDRAVDALVENAVNYTPRGGTVVLRAAATAIEVLDDGPGLAPGEEATVFSRFHRGEASRGGAPGTGLGLPIARELMRCWGGDAALDTRPEGGTRATLTAPAFTGSFPGGA